MMTVMIIGAILLIIGVVMLIWGTVKKGYQTSAETQWQALFWGGVIISIIGATTLVVGKLNK